MGLSDDDKMFLSVAQRHGLLNEKQVQLLTDELEMFPGTRAATLAVQRGYMHHQNALRVRESQKEGSSAHIQVGGAMERPDSSVNVKPAFGPSASLGSPPLPSSQRPPRPITETGSYESVAPTGEPLPTPPPNATLRQLLQFARTHGCSDLHLSIGRAPFFRRMREIHYSEAPPLDATTIENLIHEVLAEPQKKQLRKAQQIDVAFDYPNEGRYRANIYRQRLGLEVAIRVIRKDVPTFEQLGLPPVLAKLTEYSNGLVMVTGSAGSGKTSTVAAMLNHINRTRTDHIITVEDPVEYVLAPASCQVTHREVGLHTRSFAVALRAALRQDPDVIMVGELRDLETTSIAITASETGHLVFGTLHTGSAIRTIFRIMQVYPPSQRAQICTMVAESMRGVVTQQLIPHRREPRMVPAFEILLFHSGISQAIKEGKAHQLPSLMQSGRKMGMRVMDDALMELAQLKEISGREAYQRADNKMAFDSMKDEA